MKILILYVFHILNENVLSFINRGLFWDPNKTFILIWNHDTPDLSLFLPLFQSFPSNVYLLIRPNIGQDFQGWNTTLFLHSDVLNNRILASTIGSDDSFLYKKFDQFLFINSTVSGPYFPSYLSTNWVDAFMSRLDSNTKIVGISANFMSSTLDKSIPEKIYKEYGIHFSDTSHIQSMIFGLDLSGLELLISYKLFCPHKNFPPRDSIILTCEIGMSMLFRFHGYNMFSYYISQGLISSSRRDSTDNIWNQHVSVPLCELMFVKMVSWIQYPEQNRYLK